jgi:hypothetical protein
MRTVTDPINAEDIVLEVANQAGLPVSRLLGDLRKFTGTPSGTQAVCARDAAMLAIGTWIKPSLTQAQIGQVFGLSEQAVRHALQRCAQGQPGSFERRTLAESAWDRLTEEMEGA